MELLRKAQRKAIKNCHILHERLSGFNQDFTLMTSKEDGNVLIEKALIGGHFPVFFDFPNVTVRLRPMDLAR